MSTYEYEITGPLRRHMNHQPVSHQVLTAITTWLSAAEDTTSEMARIKAQARRDLEQAHADEMADLLDHCRDYVDKFGREALEQVIADLWLER